MGLGLSGTMNLGTARPGPSSLLTPRALLEAFIRRKVDSVNVDSVKLIQQSFIKQSSMQVKSSD